MSDTVKHSSAWGDDEFYETLPFQVPEPGEGAPSAAVPAEATLGAATPPSPVPPVFDQPKSPVIVSGQLSHALVLALSEERPKVGGWGALAKRLGIHSSLLQRLKDGTGRVSSVDDIAGKLGWRFIIERPRG